MSQLEYIKKSSKKATKQKKEYFIHKDILMLVQDELPEGVSLNNVRKQIEKTIPKKLFRELDYIYIGEFPELETRNVQSAYMRGAIYLSNKGTTEDSLYASVVHELGHSIESVFFDTIYGDSEVASEFVGKRKKLRSILKAQDLEFEDPLVYLRQEYNPQFDKFLYQTVGYDRLSQLTSGLFASPYGATSIREYFANGFEHFYIEGPQRVKQISPAVFHKVHGIIRGDHV